MAGRITKEVNMNAETVRMILTEDLQHEDSMYQCDAKSSQQQPKMEKEIHSNLLVRL
jgi:hypothetical protein